MSGEIFLTLSEFAEDAQRRPLLLPFALLPRIIEKIRFRRLLFRACGPRNFMKNWSSPRGGGFRAFWAATYFQWLTLVFRPCLARWCAAKPRCATSRLLVQQHFKKADPVTDFHRLGGLLAILLHPDRVRTWRKHQLRGCALSGSSAVHQHRCSRGDTGQHYRSADRSKHNRGQFHGF